MRAAVTGRRTSAPGAARSRSVSTGRGMCTAGCPVCAARRRVRSTPGRRVASTRGCVRTARRGVRSTRRRVCAARCRVRGR